MYHFWGSSDLLSPKSQCQTSQLCTASDICVLTSLPQGLQNKKEYLQQLLVSMNDWEHSPLQLRPSAPDFFGQKNKWATCTAVLLESTSLGLGALSICSLSMTLSIYAGRLGGKGVWPSSPQSHDSVVLVMTVLFYKHTLNSSVSTIAHRLML